MPRVAISVITLDRTGVTLAPTTGDPVNNHVITNDGNTAVIVENSGAVTRTVTFNFSTTVDGFAVTPRTETLTAGAKQGFGPFPTQEYGGKLKVDVDHADLKLTPITF